MVLVAPDVVRYTINGTYLGRPAVNIIDMVVQENGLGPDRHEAIVNTSHAIIDAWADNVLVNLSSQYSFNSVSWVDLNSEDGETGSAVATTGNTLPQAGQNPGDPITAAVAILVTKQTTSARGQRPGRWFVPGLVEGAVSGNILGSGYLGELTTAFSNVVEELTETSPVPAINYFPTVIHTKNIGTPTVPIIQYQGNTQITDLVPQPRVSTQRRRNRA